MKTQRRGDAKDAKETLNHRDTEDTEKDWETRVVKRHTTTETQLVRRRRENTEDYSEAGMENRDRKRTETQRARRRRESTENGKNMRVVKRHTATAQARRTQGRKME